MGVRIEPFEVSDPELLALTGEAMGAWLNSWSLEEFARYAGQYVAVIVDRHVIASDRSSAGLRHQLKELGSPKALVLLLPPDDARTIYTFLG